MMERFFRDAAQRLSARSRRPLRWPGFVAAWLGVALVGGMAGGMAGCSSTPKRPERAAVPPRDVPAIMRGLIGTEANFNGIDPVLVSGYGLVVGLNGTGGGPLNDRVAAHMEREMGLMGIARANDSVNPNIAGRSPRQLLRDPSTAVVRVIAAIPPGAPEGTQFDVYVQALNATSIEGGTLWTTTLQVGDASPFGSPISPGRKTITLAKARGAVFINPFATPGESEDGVTRTVGRVLSGGVVSSPLKIEILLDNASMQRARLMVSAINSRFPAGPGDDDDTARGRNDSSIALRVPRRFMHEPAAFIQLVKHLQVDQSYPEVYAQMYSQALLSDPQYADELSWALEAIGGNPALRFARSLYDHPELVPRLAALKAGARLNDPQAAPMLMEMAAQSSGGERIQAIGLLSLIDAGPLVDESLRKLLAEGELVVRVAAYEALLDRAQRSEFNRLLAEDRALGGGQASYFALEALSRINIPAGNLQGIERRPIGGKFLLDLVPVGDPLIYITQQGQPRVVIFGKQPELERPLVVSAWSQQLLFASDDERSPIRARFHNPLTRATAAQVVPARIGDLVATLARNIEPDDPTGGLGMSYSQVVGTLYALQQQGATPAAFATERDRLVAELLDAGSSGQRKIRPETTQDREEIVVFAKPDEKPTATAAAQPSTRPEIVPVDQTPRKAE
ncbi:MAG: flagellar basal body P-ring protein FlgI [Planctomycetota bacterium]|nr:flagellar basal body P-ring protein FlgI [Planctomycetota bacterium]